MPNPYITGGKLTVELSDGEKRTVNRGKKNCTRAKRGGEKVTDTGTFGRQQRRRRKL